MPKMAQGAPSRAPDEAAASKMGAVSVPRDLALGNIELPFDMAATLRAFLSDDLAWQERANCASTDGEAFFPEKGASNREAKRVCANCEVWRDCREYAISNDEPFGIWGGLSERERRKLVRAERTRLAAAA